MDLSFPNATLSLDPRAHARLPNLAADIRAALGSLPQERPDAKGYEVNSGIALIEISGVLVPKLGLLQSLGFATGYDGIRANLEMALQDSEVSAIAFMVDSPGGYTSGMMDMQEAIFAARDRKPLFAILDDMAASAAYCLASAAQFITVPSTGTTGSIGVFNVFMDVSGALGKEQVKPHVIHFGPEKAVEMRASLLGVGYTQSAFDDMQAEVDTLGEMFVSTVARNRGVSGDMIRSQGGRCYLGRAGIQAGLADAVAAPDEAIRAILSDLSAV